MNIFNKILKTIGIIMREIVPILSLVHIKRTKILWEDIKRAQSLNKKFTIFKILIRELVPIFSEYKVVCEEIKEIWRI